LADELGISFEKVKEINIAKLEKRYGESFSSFKAMNRDIEQEYEVLKGGDDVQ